MENQEKYTHTYRVTMPRYKDFSIESLEPVMVKLLEIVNCDQPKDWTSENWTEWVDIIGINNQTVIVQLSANQPASKLPLTTIRLAQEFPTFSVTSRRYGQEDVWNSKSNNERYAA